MSPVRVENFSFSSSSRLWPLGRKDAPLNSWGDILQIKGRADSNPALLMPSRTLPPTYDFLKLPVWEFLTSSSVVSAPAVHKAIGGLAARLGSLGERGSLRTGTLYLSPLWEPLGK